jgi:membrane dipeptidase
VFGWGGGGALSFRIVDAHNDLLIELDHRRDEAAPFAARWLGLLEQGGVGLQVCPIFGAEPEWLSELALRHVLTQVAAFHRAVDENPERVLAVRRAADLDAVERGERIGLMLSMEGVEALGYDPALIDVFWSLGVRMVGLTWNRRNPFADGAAEPDGGAGLSRLGRQLVDRMLDLGVILDLAHASERTFGEVLERADRGTVVVSHAACRAVCETPRNLSDDQLRALAARGGVLGMMLLPLVIDPTRLEIERAVAHFDHAVEVMGIDHVGLGGDFIRQVLQAVGMRQPKDSLAPAALPWDAAIEGLDGPDGYPRLIDALRAHGYDDTSLAAICGGNFLRLLRQGLPA